MRVAWNTSSTANWRRRNACKAAVFWLVRRGQLSALRATPADTRGPHTRALHAAGLWRTPEAALATCLGLSRDDAAPILSDYTENAIFEVDPFVSIDRDDVGELMRIGTERGRKARSGVL